MKISCKTKITTQVKNKEFHFQQCVKISLTLFSQKFRKNNVSY